MATMTVRTTAALDIATENSIQRLAKLWKTSPRRRWRVAPQHRLRARPSLTAGSAEVAAIEWQADTENLLPPNEVEEFPAHYLDDVRVRLLPQ